VADRVHGAFVLAPVSSGKSATVDLFDSHITQLNGFVVSLISNDIANLESAHLHDRVFHECGRNGYTHSEGFLLGVTDGEAFLAVGIALLDYLRVVTAEFNVGSTSKRCTLLAVTSVTVFAGTLIRALGIGASGMWRTVVKLSAALIDINAGITVVSFLETGIARALIGSLLIEAVRMLGAGVLVRITALVQIDALLAIASVALVTDAFIALSV